MMYTLRFVDDIAVLASNKEELKIVNEMEAVLTEGHGMKIN